MWEEDSKLSIPNDILKWWLKENLDPTYYAYQQLSRDSVTLEQITMPIHRHIALPVTNLSDVEQRLLEVTMLSIGRAFGLNRFDITLNEKGERSYTQVPAENNGIGEFDPQNNKTPFIPYVTLIKNNDDNYFRVNFSQMYILNKEGDATLTRVGRYTHPRIAYNLLNELEEPNNPQIPKLGQGNGRQIINTAHTLFRKTIPENKGVKMSYRTQPQRRTPQGKPTNDRTRFYTDQKGRFMDFSFYIENHGLFNKIAVDIDYILSRSPSFTPRLINEYKSIMYTLQTKHDQIIARRGSIEELKPVLESINDILHTLASDHAKLDIKSLCEEYIKWGLVHRANAMSDQYTDVQLNSDEIKFSN